MEIKVTLNASPEFLEGLKLLALALTGKASLPCDNLPAKVAADETVKAPDPQKPEAEKAPATRTRRPAQTPAAEAPAEEPKPEAPARKITFEDVRAAVQPVSEAGKREEVKKLLAEFDCTRVPELPEERFEEFIQRLQTL